MWVLCDIIMENYEQKYKEALETARKELRACGSLDCDAARQVFKLFPELQSIKNEKIKINIIKLLRFVRDTHHQYFDECNEAINWFEKQNEQKSVDKVEPRFKAGDWVVNKIGMVNQVIEDWGDGYTLDDHTYLSDSWATKHYRLWTTQDAKDGDILVCEGKISKSEYGQEIGIVKKYVGRVGGCSNCFETYCFIDWGGNFRVSEAMGSPNIHPATKEQCDLLFTKMKEAGYEWNSNKKELIKQ